MNTGKQRENVSTEERRSRLHSTSDGNYSGNNQTEELGKIMIATNFYTRNGKASAF